MNLKTLAFAASLSLFASSPSLPGQPRIGNFPVRRALLSYHNLAGNCLAGSCSVPLLNRIVEFAALPGNPP